MFSNFGYYDLVCHDCKETYTPRFCKLFDLLANERGLAEIGRFQVVHNGHRTAIINTNDDTVDWKLISSFREIASFELAGNIHQLLNAVYPKE